MNSPTHSDISLIVPTYNESRNIVLLLERIESQLSGVDYEIIVVDDNSIDGTAQVVKDYAHLHPRVILSLRTTERGLSSAILHGMEISRGEILAAMDADLSHDERLLPSFIRAIQEGADLAVGSRRIAGGGADRWPWYRRLTSNIATRLTFFWLRVSLSDPMSGYFALRRSLYESCKHRLAPQGYKILLEIYCKARPSRVVEFPFIFKDRRQDHSKLTFLVMIQFIQSLYHLRRESRESNTSRTRSKQSKEQKE